jgi:hypothetical protein
VAHAERVVVDVLDPPASDGLPGHHPGLDLDRVLAAWARLQDLGRPLYVLETRLLFHLRDLQVMEYLGYRSILDFLMRDLAVSDRTADTLLHHGALFGAHVGLRQAFLHGRIDRSRLDLLARREANVTNWWHRRAARVTHRQFAREIRFFYRFQDYDHEDFALIFERPPWAVAEATLRRRLLLDYGFSPRSLDRELHACGLVDPPGASSDPAENPRTMARLERLFDLLLLARSRSTPPNLLTPTLRKTLSSGRPYRVRVKVQEWVKSLWNRLVIRVRTLQGWVPDWAATVMLLAAAVHTWEEAHENYDPTERKILERDGWRCQAPGCTMRRSLEVHHIIHRSHQGSNEPENLVTLCAAHHRHAAHGGTMRVHGRAPHDLTWDMGLRPGKPPFRTYRGQKLVRQG